MIGDGFGIPLEACRATLRSEFLTDWYHHRPSWAMIILAQRFSIQPAYYFHAVLLGYTLDVSMGNMFILAALHRAPSTELTQGYGIFSPSPYNQGSQGIVWNFCCGIYSLSSTCSTAGQAHTDGSLIKDHWSRSDLWNPPMVRECSLFISDNPYVIMWQEPSFLCDLDKWTPSRGPSLLWNNGVGLGQI